MMTSKNGANHVDKAEIPKRITPQELKKLLEPARQKVGKNGAENWLIRRLLTPKG